MSDLPDIPDPDELPDIPDPVDQRVTVTNVSKSKSDPGWFEPGSRSEAAARGLGNFGTLGAGRWLHGIAENINLTGIPNPHANFKQDPSKSLVANIADSAEKEKNANTAAQQEHPGYYWAGAAPAAVVSTGAGAATKLGLVGTGAVIGAIGGVTDSSNLKDVPKNTVEGGLIGALTGSVGKALGAAGTQLVSWTRQYGVQQTKQMLGNLLTRARAGDAEALGGLKQTFQILDKKGLPIKETEKELFDRIQDVHDEVGKYASSTELASKALPSPGSQAWTAARNEAVKTGMGAGIGWTTDYLPAPVAQYVSPMLGTITGAALGAVPTAQQLASSTGRALANSPLVGQTATTLSNSTAGLSGMLGKYIHETWGQK